MTMGNVRKSVLGAVLAAAAGLAISTPAWGQQATPQAAPAATAKPTIEQFLKIRAPQSVTLAPDGRMFVRDWPQGVWQLYHVTPHGGNKGGSGPGAEQGFHPSAANFSQLTAYPDGLQGYTLSPDGKRLILAQAPGGNENTQLWLMDASSPDPATTITALAVDPKVQFVPQTWLRDSSGLLYRGNAESPSDFYVYRWDFAAAGGKGAATRILAEKGDWSAPDVSADGGRVLISNYVSASNSRIFQLDTATGQKTELSLTPDANSTAANEIVGYLAGDAFMLMLSDADGGKSKLYLRDTAGRTARPVIEDLADFEVDRAVMNDARDLLAVVTNEDGYGVLHVYSLPDFREMPLPAMERGVVSLGEFRGRTLVWSMNNARTPGLAFATTWGQGSAPTTKQLTWADEQGIDLKSFPLPELVRYTAFDKVSIPAFLWLPPGYDAAKPTPIPFVVNYHGGPEGQFRPTFSAPIQYLLSQGYGVLQPNVRGSTGYGRVFHMMDDYKNRWASVKDGVDAAEWLVAKGYATPGRIAAFGGSYGGYMSVATIVEDQERVDAGQRKERLFGASINVVGIVNLKTFLERTADYRRKLREAEYGPLSDPEFLLSVSPLERVGKINVPMFIAHGKNDPRVPLFEAEQLHSALQQRGQKSEMLVFPDEGHGFAKLQNRLEFSKRMVKFLDEYIGARK